MNLKVFENWYDRAETLFRDECNGNAPDMKILEGPITFHLIDGTQYDSTLGWFLRDESYLPKESYGKDFCPTITLYPKIKGKREVTFDVESIVSIEW